MYLAWETVRFVAFDIFWKTIYFPAWWYTKGAKQILSWIARDIKDFAWGLNFNILLKYLWKPMYGQTDIIGRFISLYVRIGYFILIFTAVFLWSIFLFFIFLLWILVPLFLLYNILFQTGIISISIYDAFFFEV